MPSSKARSLFPGCQRDKWFDSPCNYAPIIKSFGQVFVQVDEDGYSGDTFVLLGKDNKFGFLSFGWGSCSGCDALQRCDSYEEIDELIENLENSIQWFDSLREAQEYICDDEARKGSYYYHADVWDSFKRQVLTLFHCPNGFLSL